MLPLVPQLMLPLVLLPLQPSVLLPLLLRVLLLVVVLPLVLVLPVLPLVLAPQVLLLLLPVLLLPPELLLAVQELGWTAPAAPCLWPSATLRLLPSGQRMPHRMQHASCQLAGQLPSAALLQAWVLLLGPLHCGCCCRHHCCRCCCCFHGSPVQRPVLWVQALLLL
jgi:hypothetical protein